MIGLCIMLGVILIALIVIFVFGVIGIKGSERWFPGP